MLETMLRQDSLFADITVYLPSGALACLLSCCVGSQGQTVHFVL